MSDPFGFNKLASDYFDTVYLPFGKLHPKVPAAAGKVFTGLFNVFYTVLKELEPPQYNQMIIELNKAQKGIKAAANHKLVKRTPIEKALMKLLPKVKKSLQLVKKAERADDKQGKNLPECDISFSGADFYNKQLGTGTVILTVDSKPSQVKLKQVLQKGAVRFRGIRIEPSGKVNVELHMKRKNKPVMKNNLTYTGMKTGKTLNIESAEEANILEATEISGLKALQSNSIKGKIGVDFALVTGGSEITSTKALEKSYSVAVKHKIFLPKGTLKLKQTK